ncbi:MAG TPA: hypothetical protein PKC91_13055 [Ignavibacteria bacterium]|nr:hypothetical protein [Ignavibacteria bacterium]
MATEVSVRSGSTGSIVFYSTYAAARTAANSGDTINIWANLTDEQLLLKDGVNIWIAPGRIINMTSDMPTIQDDGSVVCNIFGYGIIKNTYDPSSTGDHYECIRITNTDSKISIQCDYIEGIGRIYNPSIDANDGYSVFVEGLFSTQSFKLQCNKVINKNNSAIVFRNYSDPNPGNEVNISVKSIQSGIAGVSTSGRTAMELSGNGFVTIEEIICPVKGSCLVHKSGNITANIIKLTTSDSSEPALNVGDGDDSQNLVLYFNEIQNLNSTSGDGVKVTEGIVNLIGNRIYSNKGLSLDLSGDIVSAFVQCNEIISGTKGINIYNSNEPVIIDANYIEGSNGHSGVVYCDVHTNLVLRNAKIKNTSTSGSTPHSICIYINASSYEQFITIENITVVTGNTSTGETIYTLIGANETIVKNIGLFVNKNIESHVNLEIGTAANFKYIQSSDVS